MSGSFCAILSSLSADKELFHANNTESPRPTLPDFLIRSTQIKKI